MRLIDADELTKRFRSGKADAEEEKTMCSTVRRMIKEQPTAYDVDKVVNILRQQAEQYHSRAEKYAVAGVNNEFEHMAGKAASYEYAIEIVKAGGVDAN